MTLSRISFQVLCLGLALGLGQARAQDAPYYDRQMKKDQDLGGLNQNFRELTNSAQSNALRIRDSVTGATAPGDTCLDSPTFCVDSNLHAVNTTTATANYVSVTTAQVTNIYFSDGSEQTGAYLNFKGTFTIIPANTSITNTALVACTAGSTITYSSAGGKISASANIAYFINNTGSGILFNILMDGVPMNGAAANGNPANAMCISGGTSKSEMCPVKAYATAAAAGNHSFCLASAVNGAVTAQLCAPDGNTQTGLCPFFVNDVH